MATLLLDDRDPDIVYSAGWSLGGASTEYNSTTTYTDNAGATMTLTFQGITVTIYGTIGSSNSKRVAPQTTYQLDQRDLVTYVPTLIASAQHGQRFYQSSQIPKGQHTLVVTNIISGCDPYFIDYLVVQTGNNTSSTTAITTASRTPESSPSQHPSRRAIIAGSVSAALAAGILLFGLAYFLIRRRKRRDYELSDLGSVSPYEHAMGHRPAEDNPKTLPSTQLHPPVHAGYDHGTSSNLRDSVLPPAYIP